MLKKLEYCVFKDDEKSLMICLAALTKYWSMMDRQTHGQTDRQTGILRRQTALRIVSRDNNAKEVETIRTHLRNERVLEGNRLRVRPALQIGVDTLSDLVRFYNRGEL